MRTERVAPGVPLAEEQVVWPIDDWLAIAQPLMDDPLNGLLQGNPRIGSFEPPSDAGVQPTMTLVELGRQLYQALFQATLRDSWLTAQGVAQHRGEALRLRLGLKGMRLPLLPWEVLQNDVAIEARPLATGTDVLFSRYQPNVGASTSAGSPGTVRILMAIAAPSDQQQLDLQREAHLLQQELKAGGAIGLPDLQVTILEQPGREQLTQALEQGHYQIFHFAGHSDLGASGGSLYLVNHRTGLTETLSGDDLAGLLVNNHIAMAVFNSCRGVHSAASTSESAAPAADRNLAAALVNRGIPAVLAMAERIPDEVALTLTRLFYRNLKQGYPIDLSLSRARQGLISAYGSDQLYWALPILYLNPDCDGYLTTGDRSLDNPADSLARLPHFAPASRQEASWTISEASLSSDDLQLDEIDYDDDFDLDEEDDRALVSGILQELTESAAPTATVTTAPIEPDPISTPVPLAAPVRSRQPFRFPKFKQQWLIPVGAAGVLLLAAGGFWLGTQVNRDDTSWLGDVSSVIPAGGDSTDLTRLETPDLSAATITAFNQKNWQAGEQGTIELLDRNALDQARSALAVVPPDRIDDPQISFLSGRLAWQAIAGGSRDYSVSDARRFWETAIRQQPNRPDYHRALGFAFYAEGRTRDAIAAWQKSIDLIKAEDPAVDLMQNHDALTAYAGMAIALQKASAHFGATERDDLQSKADKLYQMVISADAAQFQPNALARMDNWLWTEQAIADWQALGQ
ncbi:CHAT domain-containing protein [Microcoleus sp. FACHB-1515]|uniref:CHAT domain-containing protein n=1 Tax=Microcoleus sp. FACHB-1515 TaxID=2692821 RepID=UPI00329FFD92